MLDEQTWKGQARYKEQEFEEWHYARGDLVEGVEIEGAVKGGIRKGTSRLSLALVDEAGHMAPADQPEGVGALVWAWMRNGEH